MSKTGTSKPAKKKNSVVYKYNYYDADHKRRCKSFSAPTMREARLKAAEWEMSHPQEKGGSITVLDAVNRYIAVKAPVLSPSTVRAYESMAESCIEEDPIGALPLSALALVDVQSWVSRMDKTPKTIKNRFALLQASLDLAECPLNLSKVKLPQPAPKELRTPSTNELATLIKYTAGQEDRTLYRAILLAALGPLRRSEVCALTSDDIKANEVTINKAEVKAPDGSWVIKTTKTVQSTRVLVYPDFVMKELKGIKGRIIPCNPDALRSRFNRALKFAKVQPFSFHALRRYGASIMHTIAPDAFIKYRGGWSSNYTMQKVYIKVLDDEKKKSTAQVNKFFTSVFGQSEAKSEAKKRKSLINKAV